MGCRLAWPGWFEPLRHDSPRRCLAPRLSACLLLLGGLPAAHSQVPARAPPPLARVQPPPLPAPLVKQPPAVHTPAATNCSGNFSLGCMPPPLPVVPESSGNFSRPANLWLPPPPLPPPPSPVFPLVDIVELELLGVGDVKEEQKTAIVEAIYALVRLCL